MVGFLSSLKVQMIILALVAFSSGVTGYKIKSKLVDVAHAKELQKEIDAKMAWIDYGDQKSAQLEGTIATQRKTILSLSRKGSHEVSSNNIYRGVLPSSGVQIFNEAVYGEATREHDTEVRTSPGT